MRWIGFMWSIHSNGKVPCTYGPRAEGSREPIEEEDLKTSTNPWSNNFFMCHLQRNFTYEQAERRRVEWSMGRHVVQIHLQCVFILGGAAPHRWMMFYPSMFWTKQLVLLPWEIICFFSGGQDACVRCDDFCHSVGSISRSIGLQQPRHNK